MDRIEEINRNFTTLFQDGELLLQENGGEVMNRFRKEAFQHFVRLGGIPDKTEDYRYADLTPVFDQEYRVSLKRPKQETVNTRELFRCNVHELNTHFLLTVNGWFRDREAAFPEGVVVCSMAEAGVKHTALLEAHYNQYTGPGATNSLVALNTAFAGDGLFVYIPDGVVLEKPLQLVNVMHSESGLMAFQRNLVILGRNARATLLVCDHTLSDHPFLSHNTTEVVVGENASMDFYQVQSQHANASQVNNLFVCQKRDARFEANVITLYGGFIRNSLYVALSEPGGESNLYGMYLMDKKQQVDNFTFIDHIAPHCRSNEHFKGVLDDVAQASFSGCITVRPEAQQTEAYQVNNNLLLTDTARINTKPQLVIDADDVKCTHGATIGQMDENALFYLRSRGISHAEARLMMMFGFAHEIVGRVKLEPLREQIDDMVEKRLRGEFSKCHNCVFHCKK